VLSQKYEIFFREQRNDLVSQFLPGKTSSVSGLAVQFDFGWELQPDGFVGFNRREPPTLALFHFVQTFGLSAPFRCQRPLQSGGTGL
jgi:hypothetical protein